MKSVRSRDLSMHFYDKEVASQAGQPGRHYIVGRDGRLMKLMSAESHNNFSLATSDEDSVEVNIARASRKRVTKVIYPASSIKAMNRFMNDTGRYIQRNNNTSMSIRDYVEAKGQHKTDRDVIPKQKSIDIRMAF